MSRGRNTLILLAVALAIGAYIYFVESKRTPTPDVPVEPTEKVFTVDQAKIDELHLTGSAGERTSLKKIDGHWQIVSPITMAADEAEVSGLTTNLGTLALTRVVDEKPKDLTQYGLEPPRFEVAFKAAGDKDFRRLQVGQKTVTSGDLYAKLANDPKVFLISAFIESTLDRTTFQMQDKAVLKIDRDKVDAYEAVRGTSALKAVKQGEHWRLTQPWSVRADPGAVDGTIGRIATGQMRAMIAADVAASDLAKYGLDKPVARYTLGAGSASAQLLIGKAADDGVVYARDAARTAVFTIDATFATDLERTPADYRLKDVFTFKSLTARRLEIVRNGAAVVYDRQKVESKDEKGATVTTEKWVQTQPAPPTPIDSEKVADVASKLELRAESFVNAIPAGATEAVTFKTAFGDKQIETIVLLKAGADYYATIQGEPGAAKFRPDEVEALIKAVGDIK